MKTCTKCGVEKELGEFNKKKATKDGHRPACRGCQKAYSETNKAREKANRELNREKIKAYSKVYNEANKARRKALRQDNLSIIHSRQKAYRDSHQEELKAYRIKRRSERTALNAARRALKLNQTPADANLDLIRKLYKISHDLRRHVDHLEPLDLGGLHTESNLQIIPATENLAKWAKDPKDFYTPAELRKRKHTIKRLNQYLA